MIRRYRKDASKIMDLKALLHLVPANHHAAYIIDPRLPDRVLALDGSRFLLRRIRAPHPKNEAAGPPSASQHELRKQGFNLLDGGSTARSQCFQ